MNENEGLKLVLKAGEWVFSKNVASNITLEGGLA